MIMKNITVCIIYLIIGNMLSCGSLEIRNSLLNDGYHNITNYRFDSASTLESRIQIIPESALKLLMQFDKRNDYQSYMPTDNELKMFMEYCEIIPPVNRQVMLSSLVRIYFVKNFIGAGMVDFVLSEDRKVYTILYINPSVLTTGMSEWITNRENSIFRKSLDVQVKVNCGNKYTALMYLLLHETSHIVDYVDTRTPFVEPHFAKAQGLSGDMTPFVKDIWESYDVMNSKTGITESKNIHAYGLYPAAIDASQISSLYEKLSQTPVNSAYSAKNWAEDFADTITFYHLTQKLNQPFTITISEIGKTDIVYQPMIREQPPDRLKIIKDMYLNN